METVWNIYIIGALAVLLVKLIGLVVIHLTHSAWRISEAERPTILTFILDVALWPLVVLVWLSRIHLV